jgi:hypothetical protein
VLVALLAPFVEAVGGRNLRDLMIKRRAIEFCALVRMQGNRRAFARRFALAFPHIDYRPVSTRPDVEAIVSGLLHREGEVGSIHLVSLALVESTDVQIQRPLVQLHLDIVVTNVGQGKTSFVADPQEARAHVQLGLGIFIGPDIVGIGQRTIQRPFDPISRSLGLKRNRSRLKLQTGNAARRVLFRSTRFSRISLVAIHVSRIILGDSRRH